MVIFIIHWITVMTNQRDNNYDYYFIYLMNKLAVFEVNQELRLVKLIGIVNCKEQKKIF